MNIFSKLAAIFSRIWLIASFLNGVTSGMILYTSEKDLSLFTLSLVFSFLFSIPFILATLILVSAFLSLTNRTDIFRIVLLTSFIISIAGAFYFKDLFFNAPIALGISIVASALIGVLIFKNKLKSLTYD